jgi:hypothetical protein
MDYIDPVILARRKHFIAVLRTDEYQQGPSFLHIKQPDGTWKHCCLGVACLVAIEDGLPLRHRDTDIYRSYTSSGLNEEDDYYNDFSTLPTSVAIWYGFPSNDPDIPVERYGITKMQNASYANDIANKTFAEIADAFETQYVFPYEMPEDPSGVLEP